jgi:branched-chain amino acid transport system permease protein
MGLSLCFGTLKVMNVAHGSFVLAGCYFTYAIYSSFGVDPFLFMPFNLLIFFVIGSLFQRYLLTYAMRSEESILIIGFCVSIILQNIIILIFGNRARGIYTWYSTSNLNLGYISIALIYLIGFAASCASLIALHFFLKKSFVGKAIRAITQDAAIASAFGIKVRLIRMIAFGLGVAIAAMSGSILSMIFPFNPTSDLLYLTKSIIIIVLGGLGSTYGTFVGGIVLGVAECLGGGFFGAGYQNFIGCIIFLIILVLKPRGLFGRYAE